MELSEVIKKCRVDDVFLCEGPRQPQMGSLALIGHHLIFSPQPSTSKKKSENRNDELWLLHRAVDRVIVEPIPVLNGVSPSFSDQAQSKWTTNSLNKAVIGYFNINSSSTANAVNPSTTLDNQLKQSAYLRLKCKNFMQCCFEITDLTDAQAVACAVETLSNLSTFEHDYPFYYRCPFKVLDNGWTQFDIELSLFPRLQLYSQDRWRISYINADFLVCHTYPEKVIVPKGIGDDYLRISSTFRDGSRFPVLSYFHCKTKSSILRSGQPLVGPANRRCKEDECILNSLLSGTSKGMIFDTRSKLLAQASRTKGGGCESHVYYSQWKYAYGRVPRTRELRESLARLIDACIENSPERWLSRLSSSAWLQHISDTLTASATVAQFLHCFHDMPVLVHGAEGVDSTLLVTSLSQILLDADSRTLRGFQALIENEWISSGHPFFWRCAHSAFASGATTGPHESPVFLCFLDCVWQIIQLYPRCFEFNEQFLIFLFEHAYASEFGTFLGNSEMEKLRYKVKERTVSLWSYVNHPVVMEPFVNVLYEPYDQTLWPSVAPQSIKLWERMYLRWQQSWDKFDRIQEKLYKWRKSEMELQSKAISMQSAANSCISSSVVDVEGSSSDQHPLSRAPPIPPRSSGQSLPLIVCDSTDPLGALKLEQLNITSIIKHRCRLKKPLGDPTNNEDDDSFELLGDALEAAVSSEEKSFEESQEKGEEGSSFGQIASRLVAQAAKNLSLSPR